LLALASGFVLLAPSLWAQFVYVANGGGSNNVSAYKIGLNGSLTAVPGSPFSARNLPSSVAVDSNGKFIYVVNESSSDVSGYKIDSNGALIAVPGSPFPVGSDPHQIVIDPAGKFAYIVNAADNNVRLPHQPRR
jgi:6-phosphogluconolactonase